MALKRINKKAVEDIVTFANQVSQSFVIGLTGAEIFITSLGFQTVGLCLATKFLAVAVQIVATLMIGSGFHWKEKLFSPLAWIPKVTVQPSFISVIIMGDLLNSEISQPSTEKNSMGKPDSLNKLVTNLKTMIHLTVARKAMQSVGKTAERIIGSSLPSIRDMAYKRYRQSC